jgi:flagellar basal body rod protein FlgG
VSKGLSIALSGALAQQDALDATATNVANASSAGYQRLRPIFRAVLAKVKDGSPAIRHVAVERMALDRTPGAPRVTGSALDAVLPSGAYLAVSTPRGERYTRAVSLTVGEDGALKTTSGAPVTGEGGSPVVVSPKGGPVSLDADGTVKQAQATIGKLRIVTFERADALAPEGGRLLGAAGAGAASPSTDPLQVGAVEDSNAQPVTEMTELMTATRTFDAFQKVLDTLGDVDRRLLTTVPNPGD